MRYRTKVIVVTGGREYQPGELLPADISAADLDFLKEKKFVLPADIPSVAKTKDDDSGHDADIPSVAKTKDDDSGHDADIPSVAKTKDDDSEFDERDPDELKSPEDIKKIRSKKELAVYADSIGLYLEEAFEEKGLKELQEEIINFQEEKLNECDAE